MNHGTFLIDGAKATWTVGKLPDTQPVQLSGKIPVPKQFIPVMRETQLTVEVFFQVLGYSPSGTRIDRVLAKGERYEPYKGARCVYKAGKVEVRVN